MRDKDESLYLSQFFTTVWLRDCQTILLPFWGVSASTQFLLHSERDVEEKANFPPTHSSPPKTQFYLLTPGHGVGKQQPYPCLQRPCRLLLASYPLPFSRKAGFVLQRWVSVNVVCSLVTVLKPLMTLTRSSSSTYCKEGKKEACQPKLYHTEDDSFIYLSSYPLNIVLKLISKCISNVFPFLPGWDKKPKSIQTPESKAITFSQ